MNSRSSQDPAQTSPPPLIPLMDLAASWHVRPATARAWARRGVLPVVKIGALLFVDVDRLVQMVDEKRAAR